LRPVADDLNATLDVPLPLEVAVGGGTAVFVCGTCFHPQARIESLSLVLDDAEQPVSAHGMPRLDFSRIAEQAGDPFGHSYRSGFWGILRITGPRAEGDGELWLRARLDSGATSSATLGRIAFCSLGAPVASPVSSAPGPRVAVCMATHDPPPELFARQVESIRAQTHHNWVCLISDDCSSPPRFAELQKVIAGDERFVVVRSERRLGFYRNFERALTMVSAETRYVALADQDDFWYPEKLHTLLEEIGQTQLVYSDARVVDSDGNVISSTYWSKRRNNHTDLLSLLVANAVTGAASLFRRELLDYALPFPPAQFAHYHDHWLGLNALALGEIAFVDRPLYDYVQHGTATLGHAEANRMPALRDRLAGLREDPRDRVRMWRLHYFVDCARLMVLATILQMRCGERMSTKAQRSLRTLLRADRSLPALARLGARGARELVGRPETLGAEWMLMYAFTWRRFLALSARERPQRHLRLDAVPPPDLVLHPGRRASQPTTVRAIAEKIAPLNLAVSDAHPPRVNLMIPTIDLEHMFGGYIAKLNLAGALAERGLRVRVVTVDPTGALPRSWQRTVESYSGLEGLFDRIEVAFGRESGLEVSASDSFIATTWWSAHTAHDAVRRLGRERFLYLIQEYEPFTFPMGTYAALAHQSYTLAHNALFSSDLLRDYFRSHQIGVYAQGARQGDAASAAFENAITPVEEPTAHAMASRRPRGLLFYARPEPHAARNMFELGLLALERALEDGVFTDGWVLHGIGAVQSGRRIALPGGAELELLPRSAQARYAEVLGRHDVGLALMYTPHPSLVPIEMAAAGMLTVTNSFENKTQDALTSISPNLLVAKPTIEDVTAQLRDAAAGVGDYERRVAGSAVRWSRDWSSTFDDGLLTRVIRLLEA
jgi:glycosyltransferase involved in cell wall biosynthesis